MAKRNVSEIETGAGFFMGFVNAMMNVVREKAIPFAAIYRLATTGGRRTLDSMIDLAYADWQAEQLPTDHYRVRVTYAPLPSLEALITEFGEYNVSRMFDGHAFQKHVSCADIDETPGEKIFFVKHFNREIESEGAIAEMDKLGYRPATYLEVYAFQKANPELQRQFRIIALGSFEMNDDHRFFVMLDSDSGGRVFSFCFDEGGWHSRYRFLFVRK